MMGDPISDENLARITEYCQQRIAHVNGIADSEVAWFNAKDERATLTCWELDALLSRLSAATERADGAEKHADTGKP